MKTARHGVIRGRVRARGRTHARDATRVRARGASLDARWTDSRASDVERATRGHGTGGGTDRGADVAGARAMDANARA